MDHQDGWKASKGEPFGRANFGFTFWTVPAVVGVLIGLHGVQKCWSYQASSFSSTSSLKKASRQRWMGTLPLRMLGIGRDRIENTLYVVEVLFQ